MHLAYVAIVPIGTRIEYYHHAYCYTVMSLQLRTHAGTLQTRFILGPTEQNGVFRYKCAH